MANHKVDPLRGLNPDQSGPKEKIQNGDPNSGPERDQRSLAAEAGGPGPSLQESGAAPDDGLVIAEKGAPAPFPDGVRGKPDPEGSTDRSGSGELLDGTEMINGDKTNTADDEKADKAKKVDHTKK